MLRLRFGVSRSGLLIHQLLGARQLVAGPLVDLDRCAFGLLELSLLGSSSSQRTSEQLPPEQDDGNGSDHDYQKAIP
jgi:hypothetical protein